MHACSRPRCFGCYVRDGGACSMQGTCVSPDRGLQPACRRDQTALSGMSDRHAGAWHPAAQAAKASGGEPGLAQQLASQRVGRCGHDTHEETPGSFRAGGGADLRTLMDRARPLSLAPDPWLASQDCACPGGLAATAAECRRWTQCSKKPSKAEASTSPSSAATDRAPCSGLPSLASSAGARGARLCSQASHLRGRPRCGRARAPAGGEARLGFQGLACRVQPAGLGVQVPARDGAP